MTTPTKAETKHAMEALQKLKALVRQGKISVDAAREFAQPHIKTWDAYNRAAARKSGVPFKKFSFGGFLR